MQSKCLCLLLASCLVPRCGASLQHDLPGDAWIIFIEIDAIQHCLYFELNAHKHLINNLDIPRCLLLLCIPDCSRVLAFQLLVAEFSGFHRKIISKT